jgi:hypothetical protein
MINFSKIIFFKKLDLSAIRWSHSFYKLTKLDVSS